MKAAIISFGFLVVLLLCPPLRAQQERINLGKGINSEYSELNPIVTSDGQILFFTRKGHPENLGFKMRPDDEDIWYATRQADGSWSSAVHLTGALNTTGYDGVRAVNKAVTHLYLQNQYRPDGSRGKGFSVSERGDDGLWKYPTPLEIANYSNDTTNATLAVSADENVLILSLKRHDSKGAHDLYVSFKTGPNSFSEPAHIDELSTEGDEIAPFIGFDDQTLYVPSTGWGAESGLHDVFIVKRLDSTWMHWSKPVKLPEPINTPSADFYFCLTADADTVYLASWHESSTRGFGKSDLWKVGLPERYRPGTFIPGGATPDRPAEGALIRLDNVYFDVAKATLKTESYPVLTNLLDLLNKYPSMRIEVQGHTDNDGETNANQTLSENRANTVMRYLIDHGIKPGRLKAIGYGERQPIASNATSDGKRLNRRVMVRILDYLFKE
ncbi:MAG TPA: OmpA family protein [Candidatus Kapabacteria bacterium]|nr:OmpA family protein [Candidatus Kapabacteria bacterium]